MSGCHEHQSSASELLLGPNTILQSRYRIVRQVGKGGMGIVYEAIDLRLDHTVALKQVLTTDERLWKQFQREAQLMARLNHTALPRVSDYFTEGNRAFFVMQFVEGVDLTEMMVEQAGPFPRNAVVAWADQLLDALMYLHSRERQIIHRDIKPHNLRITSSGQIALLDFGLAKSETTDFSVAASVVSIFGYTPRYAPLEQIQDLGTCPQSDLYALGATLYHLLTGVRPPDAVTRATALVSSSPNPLIPANEINHAVGSDLAAILNKAMAQNPEERYGSAGEFREALRRLGRVEDVTDLEYVIHQPSIDANIPEAGATTLVKSVSTVSSGRLGPRTVSALFVILISTFGVFCRYYPWKIPPATAGAVSCTASGSETTGQQESRYGERWQLRHLRGNRTSEAAIANRGIQISSRKSESGASDDITPGIINR